MTVAERHRPARPSWQCGGCDRPWPCPVGRAVLVAVHGLSPRLGREASAMLEQAAADLPELSRAELWERFVAWTRPVSVR